MLFSLFSLCEDRGYSKNPWLYGCHDVPGDAQVLYYDLFLDKAASRVVCRPYTRDEVVLNSTLVYS